MTDPTETKPSKILKVFKSLLPYIIIILLILFIRAYIIIPIRVNGDSMNPTLHRNDFLILNRLSYQTSDIKRFDIVVIQWGDKPLIKRVIGLPGETVEYRNDQLFINGEEVEETFEREETDDFNITDLTGLDGEKIPENQFLVLGDNRTESVDGRHLGLFNRDLILGRANFVIFPLTDIGRKE